VATSGEEKKQNAKRVASWRRVGRAERLERADVHAATAAAAERNSKQRAAATTEQKIHEARPAGAVDDLRAPPVPPPRLTGTEEPEEAANRFGHRQSRRATESHSQSQRRTERSSAASKERSRGARTTRQRETDERGRGTTTRSARETRYWRRGSGANGQRSERGKRIGDADGRTERTGRTRRAGAGPGTDEPRETNGGGNRAACRTGQR
jgi:hypothetical protein